VRDQFLFALKLADEPGFEALLDALATCVLEQLGFTAPAIAETLAQLREALQEGSQVQHDREIQFRAEGGRLLIVGSQPGGREWRVTRALPD